jgi:phospholipase/lecithinase/hemolysin
MRFDKALVGLAVVLLGAPAAPAARTTPHFTSLVTFGDSLVDAGNILEERGFPPPSQGYFQGRYINGYDYTDLLSIELFGTPTVASLNGGSNYANGGARIVATGDTYRDLGDQLVTCTGVLAGRGADANGLYVLNLGANDIGQGLQGRIGSHPDFDTYLRAAATQYAGGVQALNDLGARNILVAGFPDLDSRDAAIVANAYLASALDALTLSGDTTLYRFDYVAFSDGLKADPSTYVLPAFTAGNCIAARQQASGSVGFATFDGYHPTAAVQKAIFQSVDAQFALTAAVPEPATWLMLVLGFAGIGGMLRRAYGRNSRSRISSMQIV